MTKYLSSDPMVFPAPSKEFKPETPSAPLYPDKFPELVGEHTFSNGGAGLCRTCGHGIAHPNHAKPFSPKS
jgi:hypothetical protein